MSSVHLSRFRSLFSDIDHYDECRREFLPRGKWLAERMPRFCREVLPPLINAMALHDNTPQGSEVSDTPFRVLSVGTAAGEVNRMLIGRLKEKFPRLHCTEIEPSVHELQKYQKYVSENMEEFRQVSFEWCNETFEEFQGRGIEENDGNANKFNLIDALEVVYYFRDFKDSLAQMYDSLKPGGLLIVTSVAENGGFHNLWKRHGDILGDDRMNFISSADVKDALKKKGIPFSAVPEPNGSRADISEVFDENSDVGNRILDFLTHICHFRKSVPQHIQDDLMSLLKSKKCSEIIDGRVLFNNSFEAIIINKEHGTNSKVE